QLYAACRATPGLVDAARALVTIPDLLNYWLTGALMSEYTVATTTQFIDARTRTWATKMLEEIGLPARLLQPLVEPGTMIGTLQASVSAACAGTPVVAPAADERSAFRSLIDPDNPAFLNPANMPATIAECCRRTGQPEPEEPAAFARAILESLAFKYRAVLESLEELTGRRFDEIRIVGGG